MIFASSARSSTTHTAACAALVLAAASTDAANDATTWTLYGVRAYPSPDSRPIDHVALVIRGDRIADVKQSQEREQQASQHAQCQGGFITAGFHNNHVHFMGEPFANARDADAKTLERGVQEMLTRFGFTTVVDTASEPDITLALREKIERWEVAGPRIRTAGWPLFPPNGLPFYLAELPQELRERLPQPAEPSAAVDIVKGNLVAGADATKLFVATPQADGSVRRMPVEIARAAVEATHSRGKPVMAHPTDLVGLRTALDAGMDILMHTTLGVESAWPAELVGRLVRQRVALTPTLQLGGYELGRRNAPESVRRKIVDATVEQLRGFVAAGGEVLFGTDVGYMADFDPTEEYVLMSKAGLSPLQILATLTTTPAARWGEADAQGRLESGYFADVIVLEGDPVDDVTNFAKVRCAFRAGRLIYPTAGAER